MAAKNQKFHVLRRGLTGCAALFVAALFCVCVPGQAQALVELKAPDASMKGATYVGNETCGSCHEDKVKQFKTSFHGRLQIKGSDDIAEGCEICHGPGSKHAESSGDKQFIINPRKDPSICFTCHADMKMSFRLPSHHPVLEGKMSCADCHELHGPDAVPTMTSMESLNDMCFKCHKDQQGPFVFEHPALREGCTACHKVHGSISDKMLVARDANLCLRCHMDTLYPARLGAATGSHASRLQGGTCWSGGCHFKPHGSNFGSILTN